MKKDSMVRRPRKTPFLTQRHKKSQAGVCQNLLEKAKNILEECSQVRSGVFLGVLPWSSFSFRCRLIVAYTGWHCCTELVWVLVEVLYPPSTQSFVEISQYFCPPSVYVWCGIISNLAFWLFFLWFSIEDKWNEHFNIKLFVIASIIWEKWGIIRWNFWGANTFGQHWII